MEILNFTKDIDKFLDDLDTVVRSKVSKILHMLMMVGSEIEMPYSKSLGNGLFELRISGKIAVIIIYFFHDNYAILLHAFLKKDNKIPKKELELAKKRKDSIS